MGAFYLCVYWYAISVAIAVMGVLELFATRLPQFLQDLVLYGKTRGDRKEWSVIRLLEVPKRWFLHFYIVGVIVNGLMSHLLAAAYLYGIGLPNFSRTILSFINSTQSINDGYTKPVMATIVIFLMFIQNVRRLYECLFVSSYSAGTINLIHWHLGIVLYSTFPFMVLSYSVLPSLHPMTFAEFFSDLNASAVVGIILFVWASYKHNESHHILASLRNDRSGKVIHHEHMIPYGGLFEYVSCPHFFCEILIYISYVLVAGWRNSGVYAIFFFVLVNQLCEGLITHKWYLKTFGEKYPQNRKVIVPYLM